MAGFGQLLVSREFIAFFGEYMRFWYSLLYLVVALANIIAVNAYLGIMKKPLNYAKVIIAPQMSWETTFVGIVAFDTLVVGVGTYVFFKPKWWYIALGAALYALFKPSLGTAAFVTSAITLAIACVLALGVSIYVLAKIWIETLKERKRRKGGETTK